MEEPVLVSIVVEMGTREMTHEISPSHPAQCWYQEGRKFLSDEQFEIFLVGFHLPPMEKLPPNCHRIDVGNMGYYGWKNEGAKASRGRYILFPDSDCRPAEGYLKRAIESLERDPSLSGLTGATRYEGNSLLTRLNSSLNFGYLHEEKKTLGRFSPMGHNIAIRKCFFPEAPFGPHKGRLGGACFLAEYAKKIGRPLCHDPELLLFHEDISYSLFLTVEQHWREIYLGLLGEPNASRWRKIQAGLCSSPINSLKRVRRLFKYGKYFQLNWVESIFFLPLLFFFAIADFLMVLVLSLIPSLLDRSLHQMLREAE